MSTRSISTLVIDDDELSRELLVLMLESAGHSVHGFSSGESALAALRNGTLPAPGCIITDMQMPGLCGAPLAEQLRAATPAGVIVLAISARQVEPEDVSAFDGFLLKPFTAEQLVEALDTPQKPTPQKPALAPPSSPEALAAAPVLDELTYHNLAANIKPEQLRQLYQLSLDDTALRAVRLRAAIDSGDQAAFVREAHALQGGCGLIGALELRALGRAMENQGLSAAALLPQISAAAGRLQRMLDKLSEM